MSEVLIFRHADGEGPGYFAEFLDRHGIPHRLIRVDRNDPVPESIDDALGVVLMGGPMSVNDPLPWIPRTLHLIRQAVDDDRPVLGHCLGGQLMSKALGGRVGANPVSEIGWLPVARVDNSAAGAWLDGLAPEFEVFHWHGETFSIPAGAAHILSSPDCPNQAFVIGNSLGMQCHVEMTARMVHRWASDGRKAIAAPTPTVQTHEQMSEALDARIARLHRVADRIYARWIEGL